MLLLDLLLRRYLVNPHQRNLRPREPIHKRLGLCLCLLFSQGVKVRRVGRVVLINREVWGPQRLIGIRQADSIDAGRVANLLDAELAARAGAPAALVAGRIAADADTAAFAASVSLTERAGSADASLAEPARWLQEAGALLAQRQRQRRGATPASSPNAP